MNAIASINKTRGHQMTVKPIVGRREDNWSQLLEKIALERDEQAFLAVFDHFAPLLKGFYLSNGTPAHIDVEELIQEVMCKVWLKAGSFDAHKSAASTWIYTIARNTRIDYIRKNAKHDVNSVELNADDIWDEDLDNQPFVVLASNRDGQQIGDMLNKLPEEQKECIAKMYMEGKSHADLSEELDLPLGTVKSRIRLGLKKLQAWLPQQQR